MFDIGEIRPLDYLVALARTGNFTRVAEELHVAQPAVSQAIRALERRVGMELFDRRARRLTEAGRVLVDRASRIRAELDAAGDELDRLRGGGGGRIRLGAIHWVEPFDLPSALAAFHATHPYVDLVLREDDASRMLDALVAGELDLVIHNLGTHPPRPGTARAVLAREPVVVVVTAADRWSRRRRLRPDELARRRVISFRSGSAFREVVDRAFENRGLELDVSLESSDLLSVRSLAAAGLGPAIVPLSVARAPGPPLTVVEFSPPIERRVVLAWRTDHVPPPAVRDLLDHLRARAPDGSTAPAEPGVSAT